MYDIDDLKNLVDMAAGGRSPADLLITNAKLVDVLTGEIRETDVSVGGGKILGFSHTEAVKVVDARGAYLLPGLIDAHIHIESSMVSPARFAGLVLPHGTTSVVADPHEIANVHGLEGIRYMLENGRHLPLNIFIALPSCVPATPFEDSGAVLSAEELEELIDDPKVTGIGEMMNFPGVVSGDYDVLAKIQLGTSHGKIVDGHAPGLLGRDLDAYLVTASDHGMNASTFTARVVASTQADLFAAVTAGYCALTGPLHFVPSAWCTVTSPLPSLSWYSRRSGLPVRRS